MATWLRIREATGLVENAEVIVGEPEPLAGIVWRQDPQAGPGWTYDGEAFSPPVPPGPAPSTQGAIVAMADLLITDEDIGGIGQAVGIGFAMALEPHVFWLFFSQPQSDPAYVTFVQATGAAGEKVDADVSDQTEDYVEIAVTNRATAEPAIPSRLALSIMRAK